MALFKINKGKGNLPTTYTEGYCYFKEDTGRFYIDTTNTAAGRKLINPDSFVSVSRNGGTWTFTKADGTTQALAQLDKATYDGAGNPITSTYLKLSGGTMTGPITYALTSGANLTNNYISAGGGYGVGSGRYGLKLLACDQADVQTGIGMDLTGGTYETCFATARSTDTGISYITFATHTVNTTAYKRLGHFLAKDGANPTVEFNVNGSISLLSKAKLNYNSTDECIEFAFI
jgi:hypothetical protein